MWTCEHGVCTYCRSCAVRPSLWPCWSPARGLWLESPCGKMLAGALGLAVLSAALNGTFPALRKHPGVTSARVPSHVFNAWVCLGVALATAPVAYASRMRCLSAPGVLSGVLFVLSNAASMGAIPLIGLQQAAGIGCGAAALVSFAFGAAMEAGTVLRLPPALAGIGCLVAGIAAIAAAGALAGGAPPSRPPPAALRLWLLQGGGASSGAADAAPLLGPSAPPPPPPPPPPLGDSSRSAAALGLGLAALAGVLGGLILAPMDWVGHECRGLPFLAALGAGVVLAAPPATYACQWAASRRVSAALPMWPRAAAGPGLLAGLLWTAAICANLLAAAQVGLAVAYPIMQGGLFVAGLWGMLLFGELHGLRPQLLFWGGGCAVVLGGVLVAGSGRAGG